LDLPSTNCKAIEGLLRQFAQRRASSSYWESVAKEDISSVLLVLFTQVMMNCAVKFLISLCTKKEQEICDTHNDEETARDAWKSGRE
jgi:hypothetical protein